MYKEKYLKYKKKYLLLKDTFISKGFDTSIESYYKNKYLALKEHIYSELKKNTKITHKVQTGGAPEFTSINTGTFLFRCAPNIGNLSTYEGRLASVRKCGDTGKTGLYFGNRVLISLAMCIEYNKLMEFGIFRIIRDIEPVIKGKYAFRQINPERYFEEDGKMIPHVLPLREENVSHAECDLQLLGANNTLLLPEHIQMGLDCLGSCELFLSTLNPEHLRNIELVAAFRFNPDIIRTADDLHRYMIQNHYPFILQKYIDDGVLIQFM
jgi:hypothetical protein